ncbi:hypothetical protein [Pelistega suis]|uniref:hypothetical protein n=1 Tax=Pelistega suis TaxID=1631957 RepID=UPI00211C0340|nr:hypothetical protein [Pelistega suis]MCQ9328429.1 hypothetical protein [Pelistega suis]
MKVMDSSFFEKTYNSFKKTVNIVELLKSQGHKAYYHLSGENIVEYPDGRKFKVKTVDNKPIEVEPYGGEK